MIRLIAIYSKVNDEIPNKKSRKEVSLFILFLQNIFLPLEFYVSFIHCINAKLEPDNAYHHLALTVFQGKFDCEGVFAD